MNKDELTTARREAERRLRRYDLGERVYDEETISVCKAVPYLLDENEALRLQLDGPSIEEWMSWLRERDDQIAALRAALQNIASTAGPTAKWARDIAEQVL